MNQSFDALVPIADLVGRGEALTVVAMLDAAGILVDVAGEHYLSVSADIVALGGFHLRVPAWQHSDASMIVAEMLDQPEPTPSRHTQRAYARLVMATIGASTLFALPWVGVIGLKAIAMIVAPSLALVTVPVNPQGRGDYYLSAPSL